MADSATLTIRIDEDLKRALEQCARAEDRSVTDFMVRAAKARIAPQCPTCGRSDVPTATPPGFVPAFDEFLEEMLSPPNRGHVAIVITTIEGGQKRAYRGWVSSRDDNRGAVSLGVRIGSEEVLIPIPRGVIVGWEADREGHRHTRYLQLGYADGGAVASLLSRQLPRPGR